MMAIAAIGFLDAAYLAEKYFSQEVPECSIIEGCDIVTTSEYAIMFGIPLALLGVIYYASIWFLAIIATNGKQTLVNKWFPLYPIVGMVASSYFVYLQLFVLQAICVYCMGSAVTSTLLFILGLWLYNMEKPQKTTGHKSIEE